MQRTEPIDLSTLPAIYSKRKTRKCSSCKCLKPMDQFLPIVINKKTVIPKTCQYCRSRRNSYYWNFESKKSKSEAKAQRTPKEFAPMTTGYVEKPSSFTTNQIPKETPKVTEPVAPVATAASVASVAPTTPLVSMTPAVPMEPVQSMESMTSMAPVESTFTDLTLPLPTNSLKRQFSETMPMMSMDVNPMGDISALNALDAEFKLNNDEMNSMTDYETIGKKTCDTVENALPESYDINGIILELQRQTVNSMMNELVDISDIIAASQLDLYSNSELELPPIDADPFQTDMLV